MLRDRQSKLSMKDGDRKPCFDVCYMHAPLNRTATHFISRVPTLHSVHSVVLNNSVSFFRSIDWNRPL